MLVLRFQFGLRSKIVFCTVKIFLEFSVLSNFVHEVGEMSLGLK